MTDIPILGQRASDPQRTIEVCRSFSRKLNLQNHGGAPYESADFFASRKQECAAEDARVVSQQLFDECVEEVRASMAAYIVAMNGRKQAWLAHPVAETNARAFEQWQDGKEKTA